MKIKDKSGEKINHKIIAIVESRNNENGFKNK